MALQPGRVRLRVSREPERLAVLNEEDQRRAIEPLDTHVEGLDR